MVTEPPKDSCHPEAPPVAPQPDYAVPPLIIDSTTENGSSAFVKVRQDLYRATKTSDRTDFIDLVLEEPRVSPSCNDPF